MSSRVLILHDSRAAEGRPDASDVLVEAGAIAAALERLGYVPEVVPVGLDLGALERRVEQRAPFAVFNLVESLAGRGELIHVVPALLEALGTPFTGCSASAQCMSSNKLAAKRLLGAAGLPVPAIFEPGAEADAWIVKSLWEHASLGLDDDSVMSDRTAVESALAARRAELGGEWFAEAFVPGRELNVAVIAAPEGARVLPVAEIRFVDFPAAKPAIVGYAAKWDADSFEYRNTRRTFGVEAELAARVRDLARECWRLFGLDGYARVDFRIDALGRPWVLEVNANPCLSPDAGFAAALATAGIEFDVAISWLMTDALRRRGQARRNVQHP
jgi:D-alanine-D-alanine ligase